MPQHCGYVALIGRPNVGKSTLLNRFLGQKLSATAHKPQTTRHRIIGIHSEADTQILFVDTPGLHRGGKTALNRVLNKTATSAITDADCVLMLIEGTRFPDEDTQLLERLKNVDVPVILVVNKVDLIKPKSRLLPFLTKLSEYTWVHSVVPVSAKSGNNLDVLLDLITKCMPENEFVFPADQLTDKSERFLAAEMVREQLTRLLDQELPYALSVEIERFEAIDERYEIDVLIWVERENQKRIVIGKAGSQLKMVGTRARAAMQSLFERPVRLQTWVKVKQGWADDEKALRSLGYGDE